MARLHAVGPRLRTVAGRFTPKVYAIDFDGVIHDAKNPVPGKRMGAPIPGAITAMTRIVEEGHTIVVHSVRARGEDGELVMQQWLDHYQVPYHTITAIKPTADVYLDDRAVRFTGWADFEAWRSEQPA